MTQVHQAMDELSTSERKVGRALLANYPAAGLESAAELARVSRVSTPTVLRFVGRLGYTGYPEFQRALIREVHEQLGSPLAQINQPGGYRPPADDEFLPYAASTFLAATQQTLEGLVRHDFLAAVDLLADPKRRIRVVGGRFSDALAGYLVAHLQLMRGDVGWLRRGDLSQPATILDAGKRDVLVAFDYRRYQDDTIALAGEVADRGGTILLLTDQYLSPIAQLAEVVLPARVDAPSPFDSLVPAMALVESLSAAVFTALGPAGVQRVQAFEELRSGIGWSGVGGRTSGSN